MLYYKKILVSFWVVGLVACGNGNLFDTTNPQVVVTIPSDGDDSVSLNRVIVASFDEEINEETLLTTTFTLTDEDDNAVAGSIEIDPSNQIAILIPSENLVANVTYTATLTTSLADNDGNNLANDFGWTFTTGDSEDVINPTLETVSPADADVSIDRDSNISIVFSEPMNPLMLTTSTITLVDEDTNLMSGDIDYDVDNDTLTFDPSVTLESSTSFTVTVTTAAEDLAGNALVSDSVWIFTTGS